MKKSIILLGLLSASCFWLAAQPEKPLISYLHTAPVIDGKEDAGLLPKHTIFPQLQRSAESNPINQAYYQLAYGPDFLYISVKYFSYEVKARDRAYQHGDGIQLMIGNSRPEQAPTEDFMVLGFSASTGWDGKVLWYYNKDLSMKRLDDGVKVMTGHHGFYALMEVLIPWETLYPFNPFIPISPPALNLCFVNAIGDNDKNTFYLVEDEKMQSENSPRKYLLPSFETVTPLEKPGFFTVLQQSTLLPIDPVIFAMYPFYKKNEVLLLRTSVYSGENTLAHSQLDTIKTGPDKDIFYFATRANFPSGGYRLHLEVSSAREVVFTQDKYFTVLPELIPDEVIKYIDKLKPRLVPGTYNTMMFNILDYVDQIRGLKPYETAYDIRLQANKLSYIINRMMQGDELISRQKGLMRRAYFSAVDSSFKPYSIFIPRYYERDAFRYPLLVFLHGSGEDDRALGDFLQTSSGDFLVMAPHGRDASNCFATPEAFKDVKAAIADVVNNYSIDTGNIILCGFSMGGYGALRVFQEFPGKFSALAILSANPNLANKWLTGKHPDYTDLKNLKAFKDKEVFLFHGKKDNNAPYDLIAQTAVNLQKAGAKLSFITEETGHTAMNDESKLQFRLWLRRISGYKQE